MFHGRLKPDNVIVGPTGEVHLVDFGCRQLPKDCERLSLNAAEASGAEVTPAHTLYASPQLPAAGQDMRALGSMLVEMVTRQRPGALDTPEQGSALLAQGQVSPAATNLALSLLSGAPLSLEEARRQAPALLSAPGAPARLPSERPATPPNGSPTDSNSVSLSQAQPWVTRLRQLFGRSKPDPLE